MDVCRSLAALGKNDVFTHGQEVVAAMMTMIKNKNQVVFVLESIENP
ncbi:MAG: hypothetical protein HW380_3287 [Magnetococcales bacterium]|nr:hypothetical protein [Magnetococcales bacterium]